MLPTLDRSPTSLLDWHAYHVAMRQVMSVTTADWVARHIIATPKDVRVRARKQLQGDPSKRKPTG